MKPVKPANINWQIWKPIMRDPPLTTIEAMTGYLPEVDGEPPQARVSLNMLADMHEAMDVEEEMNRRFKRAAEKRDKK